MSGKYLNDKNVRLTLVDTTTWEPFDIYYKLYNTNLAKKWVKLMEDMRYGEKSFREKRIKFTRSAAYQGLDLDERLSNIVRKINLFYDRPLTMFREHDQDALNYLHEEYEIYGERLSEKLSQKWWDDAYKRIPADSPEAKCWPGITFNEDFHSTFIQLNDAIHTAEMFIKKRGSGKKEPSYSAANILISFNPRIDFEITEEDAASFLHRLRFGDLVLGYNTLGKNMSHIIADNDQRAVDENAFYRQETWSNEMAAYLVYDDYDPYTLTNEYKKFKALNIDGIQGHKWSHPDNRHGYMGIGHMLGEQRDTLYSASHGLKKDLSRFKSIQDVQIVDNIQMHSAFKTPRARIPQWKFPIPVQAKKIIEIKNEDKAIITWILNDICNYACRYCPPVLHDGKNHLFNWDVVSPFLDRLFEQYGKNRHLTFSLSGGEPTLSPFFPEMIERIHTLGGTVGITTNLVRTPRFIKDNFKYLTYAACSFHPAQEFPNGTADEWLEKIKIASLETQVAARIMMDPLHWDKSIEFIEKLKKKTTAKIEIVYIDDQYGASRTKLAKINYSEEQLEFFKTFKETPSRSSADLIRITNPIYRDFHATPVQATFEDNTTENITSPQGLINKGQTNFYDYLCNIGAESLFIHQNGHIKRGNCDVGGVVGSVKEFDKINWDNFSRPVICNSLRCHCGGDIPVSKWKGI